MIFKSKKAFNDEVDKRIDEINFKTRTDEAIWKLQDDIRSLQFRVDMLEKGICTAIPTPVNVAPVNKNEE